MKRWAAIAVCSYAAVCAWGACNEGGDGDGAGTGGAATTTTTTTTTTTSTTFGCSGAPDGLCQLGESCDECPDCAGGQSPYCGACADDGSCDDLDACTCPDCAAALHVCGCVEDGACDAYAEGCHCSDCAGAASCADEIASCDGAAPDGACTAGGGGDGCACPDCAGVLGCAPCLDDGSCGGDEACSCLDCLADPYCTDTMNCLDDGVCVIVLEGCACADCAPSAACGAGGAGGAGGGGGPSAGGGGAGGG